MRTLSPTPPSPSSTGRTAGSGGTGRWARTGSRAVPAAIGTAVAAIAAADLVNPQYSPVTEVISRYVNGTAGWLVTTALFLVAGASGLLLALLRRAGAPRIGRWAVGVWAAGIAVAGVFPADPPGRWGRPSTSDIVHGMAATPAFLALPVAALVLHGWLTRRWTRGAGALRAVLGTSLVSTAVLLVCLVDVMDGPSLGTDAVPTLVGLVERIAFGAGLAWVALAAVAASRPAVRA
ncbi:DUF998 domain-containing protein [Streptomyces sp. G2]|uniref:DUF998 domain-containing protein n=1 Tax=Streptomyces TaxID=1883 RepID=UPI00202DC369|nr:DUF998 domain-containing protein [Streptomyces sp. G2]MCM1948253.1 DUF998 domain-containing protein [Streptomyces sp. G2]